METSVLFIDALKPNLLVIPLLMLMIVVASPQKYADIDYNA